MARPRDTRTFAVLAAISLLAWLPAPARAESGTVIISLPELSRTVLVLDLSQGDVVDYSWSANADIEFLIAKEGPLQVVGVYERGVSGSGTLTVSEAGRYDVIVRNTQDFSPRTVNWMANKRFAVGILLVAVVLVAALVLAVLVGLRYRQSQVPAAKQASAPRPPILK